MVSIAFKQKRPWSRFEDLLNRLTQKIGQKVRWAVLSPRFLIMAHLARFIAVREWVADRGGYCPVSMDKPSVIFGPFDEVPVESSHSIANKIKEFGYYEGFQLKPDVLAGLLEFAQTTPCYANRDPKLEFFVDDKQDFEKRISVPILKAGYQDLHEDCEAFKAVKEDAYLVDIASQYLGHEAVYLRGEIAWDFPAPTSLAEDIKLARVYHCDINDYKTIKFFFYLTDVGLEDGAHIYLKGSHRHRKFKHQWIGQSISSVPDQVLVELYGDDRVKVVTGPAGCGFAGDPYCLHKGTVPQVNRRLLLQLEFGMSAYKTWYF